MKAARIHADAETEIMPTKDRSPILGELLETGCPPASQGTTHRLCNGFCLSNENIIRLCRLAQGADRLFIEGGLLEEDRDLAAAKKHLTARQAGEIARCSGVHSAHRIHLSSRYFDPKAELQEEFEKAFRPPGWGSGESE